MSKTFRLPSDFLASAYLTGYRGTDRDEIETCAADAASAVLRKHGIGFTAAIGAAASRANGDEPDALSVAAYDAAEAAAADAVAADIASANGAFISLGWR